MAQPKAVDMPDQATNACSSCRGTTDCGSTLYGLRMPLGSNTPLMRPMSSTAPGDFVYLRAKGDLCSYIPRMQQIHAHMHAVNDTSVQFAWYGFMLSVAHALHARRAMPRTATKEATGQD